MFEHCWYKLNIDLDGCFLPTFKFPQPLQSNSSWYYKVEEVFTKKWLVYLYKLGIPLYSVMIFYRGPNDGTGNAHVDVSRAEPLELTSWGINWVYGGKGSSMVWYNLPEIKSEDISLTKSNRPYISWDTTTLNEIDRIEIKENQTVLVRTDLPHAIEMGNDPRWCFSVRTADKESIDWIKTLKLFKIKNLVVER